MFKLTFAKPKFLFNVIFRTKKLPPAKINQDLRDNITQAVDGRYRTRSNDIPDEVKDIIGHNKHKESDKISVTKDKIVGIISGVTEKNLKIRNVRIFMPAKNSMQSGTHGTRNWRIEFNQCEKWENNLMGWTSTGDPLSTLSVDFKDSESAMDYCESMGWSYQIERPNKPVLKPKSYGSNFSWNKRTRVTTK